MKTISRRRLLLGSLLAGAALCGVWLALDAPAAVVQADPKADLLQLAKERNLTADDMVSAVSTWTNHELRDEYVCLNSGGQAGSVIVYGVPSMRLLKYIPTAAPDSATGFHYDEESREIMRQGFIDGRPITWGDTHHPAFSEQDGKYDGRFAFINDKANPRIFVMDLRDFELKQIVPSPLYRANHGGAFVTPNTEYVIEAAQYAGPLDRQYRPLTQSNFNKYWRGGVTFHKFDKEAGRIELDASFTIEAPPYIQDLSDAGKGESFGWSFTNSLCSERYIGGIEQGRPPWEAGCSARDMDYLHVINWQKAAEVVAAGKAVKVNGHNVIPMQVAIDEGLLFLIPEAKSPHGVDVSPDGRFIVVAGKLDTHGQVFDIRKIKDLIERKEFAQRDPYGVPILDYKKALHGQVQLGLGPLHTQFDPNEGIAYTSVYIDSVVVKWDFTNLKVLDKQSVHYNIGHLVSMQGDSQDPRGKYVISLNKLAIDRFNPVGPLHPQNHQLVSVRGDKMRLLYDMPLPMGEPHYTTCIDARTLKAQDTYAVGTDPATMKPSAVATRPGQERIEREGKVVRVFGTLSSQGLSPAQVEVTQGEEVLFHLTNVEERADATAVFTVGGYNALGVYPPGKAATVKVSASQAGLFVVRVNRSDDPFAAPRLGMLSVKPDAGAEERRKRLYTSASAARAELASWEVQATRKDLAPGEQEFVNYGCSGCHRPGRELGGPDLNDVTARRTQEWLEAWITAPDKMYEDPNIVPLIEKFGVKMPNQGVTLEEARAIIGYLKTWKSPQVAQAPAADSPGAKAYGKVCFACHDNAVGGAPKIGDKGAWGPRLAKGDAALMQSVINGLKGEKGYMPPRGGCSDCTDEELKAAMQHLTEKAR